MITFSRPHVKRHLQSRIPRRIICARAIIQYGVLCALMFSTHAMAAEETQPDQTEARIDTIVAALADIAPAGYTADGPVERYNVDNIYDKINGRSELHMAYGLVGLAYVRLAPEAEDAASVEVYLYDMGSVPGAFGVYSVERWEEGEPVDAGRAGYRHRDDLNFWHGPYYVNLVGAADDEAAERAQRDLAGKLVARLDDPGDALWGPTWLPAEGRVERSLQYFMVDALSLDFLTETYTARYVWDGTEYTVFVSRQTDAPAAVKVLESLRAYHERYSDSVSTETVDGEDYLVANIGGDFFDVATQKGRYVLGVTTAEGRCQALAAAQRLHTASADE